MTVDDDPVEKLIKELQGDSKKDDEEEEDFIPPWIPPKRCKNCD